MKIHNIPQHLEDGTANPEWLALRAGKFSGSDFHQYMAIVEKGKLSDSAETALHKKVLQGLGEQFDSYKSESMERGNELEPIAREMYIQETFNDVQEIGFADWEQLRAGCSPDGVIYGADGQIDKIIEIKCLPDGAQILTDKGFVDIKDITKNHKVAQYTEDKKIEFVKPKNVIHKPYCGELYNFYRYNKLTMSCTPDHRIIYLDSKGNIKESSAKDFPTNSNRRIPVGGLVEGENGITDKIRFLIACNADGHPTSNKSITFDFSKPRKIERIKQLLTSLNFDFVEHPARVFDNEKWLPSVRIVAKVPDAKKYKCGLSSIGHICDFNSKQANEMLQEISMWDGTVGQSNTISYTSIKKEDVDFVAALCVIANKKSNVVFSKSNNSYMITISGYGSQSKLHKPLLRFSGSNSGQKIEKSNYCGNVHCITVPSGMFVARMPNACAFVTGNCPEIVAYIKYAEGEKNIPAVYKTQMQYNMLITGAKSCDFVAYHPNMQLAVYTIDADADYQAKIVAALEKLNERYDEILETINKLKIGD